MSQANFNDGDALSIVRGTVNGNANDAESRLSTNETNINGISLLNTGAVSKYLAASGGYIESNIIPIDATLSSIAQYLSGGVYTMPDNKCFMFTEAVYNFGTDTMDFSHTNGCYFLSAVCLPIITYTGTGAFITNSAQGTLLNIERIFIDTPNGSAFNLTGNGGAGNSLIVKLVILLNQELVSTITDFGFLTTEFLIGINQKAGVLATNVDIYNLGNCQYNNNQDLGGSYMRIAGTGTILKIDSIDSRPEASESFLDIDPGYAGSTSINGGVHIAGGVFFKAGSKTQNDADVLVESVQNIESSDNASNGYIADGDEAATVAAGLGVQVVIAGTWTVETQKRFTLDTAGKSTYIGIPPKSLQVFYKFMVLVSSGNARTYNFYVRKNGVTLDLQSRHFASLDTGTPQMIVLDTNINFASTDYVEVVMVPVSANLNLTASSMNQTIG